MLLDRIAVPAAPEEWQLVSVRDRHWIVKGLVPSSLPADVMSASDTRQHLVQLAEAGRGEGDADTLRDRYEQSDIDFEDDDELEEATFDALRATARSSPVSVGPSAGGRAGPAAAQAVYEDDRDADRRATTPTRSGASRSI